MSVTVEITGVVKEHLQEKKGTGKKGEWIARAFLLETDSEYDNVFMIESFNKDIPSVGSTVTASANVKTTEWQGKYFTKLSLWKFDVMNGGTEAPY